MPYINIQLSKPVDNNGREELQKKIADIMELIPGKNASNTTICISDNYSMFRDGQPIEGAFVDVRLYKESPIESKKAFALELFIILDNILSIPQSRVQMNFIELPCWASNGELF